MENAPILASESGPEFWQRTLDRHLSGETPADAGKLLEAAVGFHRSGRLEEALAAFECASALLPDASGILHAIAALCLALNRPQAALTACNKALERAPENAENRFNAGVVLSGLGLLEPALHACEKAMEKDPEHTGAAQNRLICLLHLGRIDEAIAAGKTATEKHPDHAGLSFNLAEAYTTAGRHEAAYAAYARALALDGGMTAAAIAGAVSAAALGRLVEASERLSTLRETFPEAFKAFRSPLITDRFAAYPELDAGRIGLIAAYAGYRNCDWAQRNDFIQRFMAVVDGRGCPPMSHADLPFLGIGLPLPADYRRRAASQVAQRIAETTPARPLIRARRPHGARLRIGYVSGDFRQHPTAYLIGRLFALHDKKRFETFAYSIGPDEDGPYRQRFRQDADHFIEASGYDTPTLAQRIAYDRIDLLIDLQGYTLYARPHVFSLRPAPLQITYLAYLATLGAPWIDYTLLDRTVLAPDERKAWTEHIAYLPDTLYLCDDTLAPAPGGVSRAALGLPEGKFVFCCLNAPWKISPEDFSLWIDILRRAPASVLWLYADSPASLDALGRTAKDAGLEEGRLFFTGKVAYAEHLARFAAADVFLDTRLCNAHTTAIEALSCGLPVITWPGESVVARVGASLLKAHGLDALIASGAEAYADLAVRLATDGEYFTQIRKAAGQHEHSRLFASERRVREIECAYEMMWKRHSNGLPPEDFDVPPLAG